MAFWFILNVLILIIAGIHIYTSVAPQFGQKPRDRDIERIKKSENFREGIFQNPVHTEMPSFSTMIKVLPEFFKTKNGKPGDPLPVKFGQNYTDNSGIGSCHITWYGHSAFLIEMDGMRFLLDPMLGETASPVSMGSKRFKYQKPIPLSDILNIDAIILSHDHYDHLDYPTILHFRKKVKHYYTPLGVGSHLKRWGIPRENIIELDWWEGSRLGNIHLTACPARHFSGRGPRDRFTTQWCSWVIKGEKEKIFFSADSGYGPHFKEIGRRFGPFDLAMLECGQYNKAWEDIHMLPEQSVMAGEDVKSKLIMPIHWGAFKLAVHEWTEPVERFKAESARRKIPVIHPYIGQRFNPATDSPGEEWWKGIEGED